MYSDHEVECLYLGKPFLERRIQGDDAGLVNACTKDKGFGKECPALPLLQLLFEAAIQNAAAGN